MGQPSKFPRANAGDLAAPDGRHVPRLAIARATRTLRVRGAPDLAHPYIAAVVLVLIAFGVRLALDPVLLERSPLLIFTAAIVVAAGRYGTAPGVVAMLLSLVSGVVFVEPGFPPAFSPDELASFAAFIVTSVAMLIFAAHMKALREREQELQAALQQAHTESALGAMAATLAHELSQPLAAAANYIGASKQIASRLDDDGRPTLTSGLDEAEAQIRRAGDIIRHARDLVSNVSAVRERASLKDMVASVLKPLQASGLCERVDLQVACDAGADELFVNSIQIEQVLLNLVRNSCQARRAGKSQKIIISASPQEDVTLVEIRDFGPGIEEERLKTLFSPKGGSSTGGLGLGLSISRTIVEAHGGRMWAKNRPEGGASFFVTLPRVA